MRRACRVRRRRRCSWGKVGLRSRRTERSWCCCGKVAGVHLAGTLVGRVMKAGDENNWSELLKSKDFNASTRVRDTGVLPQGEAGGRSAEVHSAADPAEEHALLEADHDASRRAGRGHTVVRVPSPPSFPDRRKTSGGCQRGTGRCSASTTGGNPHRVSVIQDSTDCRGEGVFGRTLRRRVPVRILFCALKLWAHQQSGGDSLVHVLVEGLQEQSKLKMTDELRRFMEVDNHEGSATWRSTRWRSTQSRPGSTHKIVQTGPRRGGRTDTSKR